MAAVIRNRVFQKTVETIVGVRDLLGVMEGCVWRVEGDSRVAGRESPPNANPTFQIC